MFLKSMWRRVFFAFRKNYVTLVLFEVFYRVVGVFLVFPLARSLFMLSLRLQGTRYITNRMLLEYIQSPFTIGLLVILALLAACYIAVELIFLGVILEHSSREERIGFFDLLRSGARRIPLALKRHHVKLVAAAALFFFAVEILHVSPMAGTLALPPYLAEQIADIFVLRLVIGLIFFGVVCLFLLIAHHLVALVHPEGATGEKGSSGTQRRRRNLVKATEFLVLNIALNLAFYVLFALIVLLVAFFVYLFVGSAFIIGIVLTAIHGVYLLLSLLASMVLLPLNYSLVESWRQRFHHDQDELVYRVKTTPSERRPLRPWVKTALLVVGAAFVVWNFFAVGEVLAEERSAVDYFNRPRIIAHRGASKDAPENTLAALEEAIRQRADYVEYDVRLTKDNEAVLMHDATLSRTTDAPAGTRVSDLTLAEIRTLDAGGWHSAAFAGERVPTLEEAVLLAAGRVGQFIELKVSDPLLEAEVLRLVAEHELYDEVRIISFDADQLRRLKAADENIETVYLVSLFFGSIRPIVEDEAIDHVAFAMQTLEDNPHWVDRLKRAGKEVHVWTVNEEDKMREAVRLEVDGIITDLPLKAMEIAHEKNTPTYFAEVLRLLFGQ